MVQAICVPRLKEDQGTPIPVPRSLPIGVSWPPGNLCFPPFLTILSRPADIVIERVRAEINEDRFPKIFPCPPGRSNHPRPSPPRFLPHPSNPQFPRVPQHTGGWRLLGKVVPKWGAGGGLQNCQTPHKRAFWEIGRVPKRSGAAGGAIWGYPFSDLLGWVAR